VTIRPARDDASRPEVLAIGNVAAGSAQEALAAAVVELRRHADVELVVPADTEELRAALEVAGDRRVVVLGGDGSVHVCVAALDRLARLAEVELALVPLGTGNDLARATGIPLDAEDAARLAVTGRPQPLDLLRDDDGGVTVNAVHAGIGAEASARAADRKPLLRAAAYPVGAVQAGATERGWRLRVCCDGRVLHDGADPLIMVAVGVGSTIGGGTPVAPDASPTDGLADVVVSAAAGPLARVGYALALRDGAHGARDDVQVCRGRVIEVEALDAEDAFRTAADGEIQGPFTRRRWTVEPGAWRLVLPG